MFYSSNIDLRIQRLDDKQCRSRQGFTLSLNSTKFISGALSLILAETKSEVIFNSKSFT